MCGMCWLWKLRTPPKPTYRKHPFAVLWDTVIGSIYLSQMDVVTSVKDWLQQVHYESAIGTSQKALDVLKHKRLRFVSGDDSAEHRDERIAFILTVSSPR